MRAVERRYSELPLSPLLAHTEDMHTLAELTGVSRRTLQRDAVAGLTLDRADRYATAVGLHPSALWPCWLELGLRFSFCAWCTTAIVQEVRRGARRRVTCSRPCKDRLSRNRDLDARRRRERNNWLERRTPEMLAAKAERQRAQRNAA